MQILPSKTRCTRTRRRVAWCAVLSVLVLCQRALAEPLELGDVQVSAGMHFPTILAADAEVLGAQAEQLAADGGFDPLWVSRFGADPLGYYRNYRVDSFLEQATPLWGTSVFAGYRLGRGDVQDYKGGLLTNDHGELRAGLSVPLVRNGPIDRRRAQIARSDLAVTGSLAMRDQTKIEVVRAASHRYLMWVGAGLRRELAVRMLRLAQERDSQIARRVGSGDLAHFERVDNQRTVAQREVLLVQATRSLQQSAIELSLYWRNPEGAPLLPASERLPPLLVPPARVASVEQPWVDLALEQRPDLKRTVVAVDQTEVELKLQKNQLLPGLDIRVAGSQDLGPGSATRRPFELEVGVVFEMPLAFRLQRGRVAAADASRVRANATLQLLRDRIVAEVRDALSAVQAAQDRHEKAKLEAEYAWEVTRMEEARFALGESTVLTVNLRETASLEAEVRVIDAAVDAHRAMIDLQAITATLGG